MMVSIIVVWQPLLSSLLSHRCFSQEDFDIANRITLLRLYHKASHLTPDIAVWQRKVECQNLTILEVQNITKSLHASTIIFNASVKMKIVRMKLFEQIAANDQKTSDQECENDDDVSVPEP